MSNLKFDKIKDDYKLFVEYFCLSESIIEALIFHINKFLYSYCKTVNYDEEFVCELITNLGYLENFYFHIDSIAEDLPYLSLENMHLKNKFRNLTR